MSLGLCRINITLHLQTHNMIRPIFWLFVVGPINFIINDHYLMKFLINLLMKHNMSTEAILNGSNHVARLLSVIEDLNILHNRNS